MKTIPDRMQNRMHSRMQNVMCDEMQKKEKLNNQGMSLVELLLAVVIITAVSVIFFNGFIVSSNTNSKSRLHQKATDLAQSILESLKTEDMDSIMHQFEYPSYTVNEVRYINFDLLPESIVGNTYTNMGTFPPINQSYAVSEDGGRTATYVPTSDDKYYLYMQNLDMDGLKFDTLITIDGTAYTNGDAGSSKYNDNEEVQIDVMDGDYDAIISGTVSHDADALNYFESRITGSDPAQIKRTITVDVNTTAVNGGTENEVTVEVNSSYEYVSVHGSEYYDVTDYVFDNSMDHSKKLRNVYLFFEPTVGIYDYTGNSPKGWKEGDNIVINNDAGLKFDLFLIKVIPSNANENNNFPWEDTYVPQIYLNGPTIFGTDDVSPVRIRTNLGYYLKNNAALGGGNRQAKYYYNGAWISDAVKFFDLKSLSDKAVTDKLMDVKIEVFVHGSDGKPSTMDDFLNEKVGEKRVTMQGTIRN